jgi:hypothetical protein
MTRFDLKSIELPEAAAKPLYAGVGATDLAVAKVRDVATTVQTRVTAKVAEVQQDVTTRVTGVQQTVKGFALPEPKDLQARAVDTVTARRAQVEAKVGELQADAVALPGKVQTGVKIRVDENVATVVGTYGELAKRGEAIVTRLRSGAVPAVEQVAEQVESVQQTLEPTPAEKGAATRAEKQAATKPAGKKAPAKKAAAKKAPAKKSPAKKSAAKKSTATKSTD